MLAGKHLADPQHPVFRADQGGTRWNPQQQIHLTPDRWQKEFKDIVTTARAIRLASPRDPGLAATHLVHARQWEAVRGKLTLPLHGLFDYSWSESEKLDQLRRANGRILGIEDSAITAELDSRDELAHALKHYLIAAEKSTHPDIAAPALESANEILFKLSEFSLYRCSRAAETDATALSNQLVRELRDAFEASRRSEDGVADDDRAGHGDAARIVDAVPIGNQAAVQSADVEQRIPVRAIAGEAGHIDRQD